MGSGEGVATARGENTFVVYCENGGEAGGSCLVDGVATMLRHARWGEAVELACDGVRAYHSRWQEGRQGTERRDWWMKKAWNEWVRAEQQPGRADPGQACSRCLDTIFNPLSRSGSIILGDAVPFR
jgi:hypothetical protein